MRQSALVVEVPEAEPVVGMHRQSLDPSASMGVPAHLTVLFPFMAPTRIGAATLDKLSQLFDSMKCFDFRLSHTGWFGGDVLWVAPDEPVAFVRMTERVHAAFPDFAPFGGTFDEVIPHLTIAQGGNRTAMLDAEQSVLPQLPIHGRAHTVALISQVNNCGSWTRAAEFSLAESTN